jgi:hypothetical protein
MGELAEEPEESFTSEYSYCLDILVPSLITLTLDKDASTVYSENFFRWFLASKNDSWRVPRTTS